MPAMTVTPPLAHDEVNREAAAELQCALDELDAVRPGADRAGRRRRRRARPSGTHGCSRELNAKRSRAGSPVNGRCSDPARRRSCRLKTPIGERRNRERVADAQAGRREVDRRAGAEPVRRQDTSAARRRTTAVRRTSSGGVRSADLRCAASGPGTSSQRSSSKRHSDPGLCAGRDPEPQGAQRRRVDRRARRRARARGELRVQLERRLAGRRIKPGDDVAGR